MVSYAHPQQLGLALDTARKVYFDNGAFSFWRKGTPTDWPKYYSWLDSLLRHPRFGWACIPDIIDGSEDENNRLIEEWPFKPWQGVPIWHLHESLSKLDYLCSGRWPVIALGSSGVYKTPNSKTWWGRMEKALNVICDLDGKPRVGIHGLRMLNPALVEQIPFVSCDAVTVAINIGMACRWPELYKESSKAIRAEALAVRLESAQSPSLWRGRKNVEYKETIDDEQSTEQVCIPVRGDQWSFEF
jgi:hypothetical protein